MNNTNLVRGLVLMAVALVFGLGALNYPLGQLSRSGPGMFPLIVSSMLFLIGVISVVRSFFVKPVPLGYNLKNIFVIHGEEQASMMFAADLRTLYPKSDIRVPVFHDSVEL